jgi:hypothetical protein
MNLEIAGKTALITGGSKGIGKAIAEALAEEGCNVVIAARDEKTLNETAESIRSRYGVGVKAVAADLSGSDGLKRVADAAGDVDILVNNAGAIPQGDLLAVDDAAWRLAWDLKVFGYISLSRLVYPKMAAKKSGVIINIIGGAGEKFNPAYVAGTAGNAALMGLSRAMGKSSTRDGIRVIGLNPGAIATERQEKTGRGKAKALFGDESRWKELYKDAPFGRLGRPEEIAWMVAFLASPRAGYVSGTIVTVDGGA